MSPSEVAPTALRWYLVVSLLAWLMYPLLYRALRRLPDGGISLVRPLGLLVAVLGSWWLSAIGLIGYSRTLIVAVPIVVAFPFWLREARRSSTLSFLKQNWPTLLAFESAALLLFGSYVVFRSYNPAIAFTEKPMELAFLTSTMHAVSMPPPDPWFAGSPINYYYLGYVVAAAPARIAGIAPSVAFNLTLATLFSTATVAAAGCAANVARSVLCLGRGRTIVTGVLGAVLLVGIGNLVTPLSFLRHPSATLHAGWWQGVGWNASRVIVDGSGASAHPMINEFPAFSFVLGDVHPHVLAYPIFISMIGVGLAVARSSTKRDALAASTLAGMVAGALYATNAWDMPPALLLALLGILVARRLGLGHDLITQVALLLGTALLSALPFAMHYSAPIGPAAAEIPASIRDLPVIGTIVRTIGVVLWPKSSTSELLKIHGLFLLVAWLALALLWRVSARGRRVPLHTTMAILVGAALLSVLTRFPALFLFGVPLAACVYLLTLSLTGIESSPSYLVGLLGLAFLLLLIPELVFLQDAFGNRMNTLFKLSFQAWALLAVASAAVLPALEGWLRRWIGSWAGWPAVAVIGVLIASSALYPPLSAFHWTSGFDQYQGLDGLAYVRAAAPDEWAAIQWLNAHARPGDHLLEAPGCSYGESGGIPHDPVSMATGLPIPLGWSFHEYQWRSGEPSINAIETRRQNDVRMIYDSPRSAQAQALLDRYGITYILVGKFERQGFGAGCQAGAPYSAAGLQQLNDIGWPIAFRSGSVVVYERPGTASTAN